MPRADKVEKVRGIKERLQDADAAVFADYRGLTVHDIGEVRAALAEVDARFAVVKNSLARLAVRDAGLEDLEAFLDGPTAIAFVKGDPVAGAKRIVEAARRFPVLEVKGGLAEGRVLTADEIKELATLEGREEMLAKVAGLLGAHLSRAAFMFSALQSRFLGLLEAYREKLAAEGPGSEDGGGEPDASAEPPSSSGEGDAAGSEGPTEGGGEEDDRDDDEEKEEEGA